MLRSSRRLAALALALTPALVAGACHGGQAVTGEHRGAGPRGAVPTSPDDRALPEIDGRPAVVAHYGQLVRLRARYESRPLADVRGRVWTHGPFLVLDDGTLLLFDPSERPPAEVAAHEGRRVEVAGILSPPAAPSFDVASIHVESLRALE